MQGPITLVLVAAMIFGTHGTAAEDMTPPAKNFRIAVRIFTGDPQANPQAGTLRVIAESWITTIENRPASVSSGQEIAVPGVTTPVQLGTKLKIIPSMGKDGRVRLDITMSNTTTWEKKKGRAQFHTQTTRTIATIKPGEVLKVDLAKGEGDKQLWAEMALDDVLPSVSHLLRVPTQRDDS